MFGAIEAGGTKFICGIGSTPADFRTIRIPTTTPAETIGAAIDFLRAEAGSNLASVGIGSFGPVDLDRRSPHYGHITSTPKNGWQFTDLAGPVGDALGVPVGFDTDVNAAALGEARWGAARDVSSCLYLTIGTGIGGGAILDGKLLHGMTHPEMGHILIPHDRAADPYGGGCPFHSDCLEGLASGPAMKARWGLSADELPPEHPAWRLEARYLALAVANLTYCLSPARVILGGGVMQQPAVFEMIRGELVGIVSRYIHIPDVVPPGLGERSGVLGALALAMEAARV